MKKITVLGGGTGSFVVLTALKKLPVDLRAIVTMMDSGGSTGRLRDQLGVLPPGDLRQCLVALSDAPELWRKLMTYRFEHGDLKGHSFGNILLSALEKVSRDYKEVLDEAHHLMNCSGRVHPAALSNADIEVTYSTGRVIGSEKLLDEENPDGGVIVSARATPEPTANPEAIQCISESDFIISGPGDLYSSIISISLVKGMREAVSNSRAKLIFVMNIMTKSSQTKGYGAWQHLLDFATYFGRMPDVCVVSCSKISPEMAAQYAKHGEGPVVDDLQESGFAGEIIVDDLLDRRVYSEHGSSAYTATFAHSIVRHDAERLRAVFAKILSLHAV
jgi:uncharacterized cofD-like protein